MSRGMDIHVKQQGLIGGLSLGYWFALEAGKSKKKRISIAVKDETSFDAMDGTGTWFWDTCRPQLGLNMHLQGQINMLCQVIYKQN